MKMLTVALMLVMSISTFASSETKTFFFDGTQDSVQMSLQAEETHTEYRYEQIRTTCRRQVVHYRTTCHPTPHGNVCQTIPYYRTVYYPCIQTIRVPYEVKDFDVEASVDLKVKGVENMPAGESFKVTLNGANISVAASSGSKNFFIMLTKQAVSSSINGSVKFVTASYEAELVPAAAVVKALEMTNIAIKDSVLSFKMGPVAAPELIGYHLTVKKAPIFGSDTVLFDRELASSEIVLNSAERSSVGKVDIHKLGVALSSGRHTLTAKAFFKHAGTILNASQFEATEASRTLIYKVR